MLPKLNTRQRLSALAVAGLTLSSKVSAVATGTQHQHLWKDSTLTTAERVADLMAKMNNTQKAAQLIQGDITNFLNLTGDDMIYSNSLSTEEPYFNASGLAFNADNRNLALWAGYQGSLDRVTWGIAKQLNYSLFETEIGIPPIPQTEGLHGVENLGTVFPSPLGMACSFNRTLINQVGTVIGSEARAIGVRQVYAPDLDLARELRWGRVEETYGEDPYLVGEMGYGYVTGVQAAKEVIATCKHFAGYGTPFGGLNTAPVLGGERDMRMNFLQAFKRACVDGEALSLMSAYASYDFIPDAGNYHLLTEILRDEWNWAGYVTDDSGAITFLREFHEVVATDAEAAALGINSGNDCEMGGGDYTFSNLPELVANGSVTQARLDQAVERVLTIKFNIGLFDSPYPLAYDNATLANYLRTNASLAIEWEMEKESIVLLKNDDNVLPFTREVSSVALLGPGANALQWGDYVLKGDQFGIENPLAAIQNYVEAEGVTINYAQGAEYWSNDQSGFAEALEAVEKSDVAVLIIGTWTRDQTDLWSPWPGLNATTGEHVDLSDLHLVGAQRDLAIQVIATGKPTVLWLVSGKPITEPEIFANATAVVQQFYPGMQGSKAIAETLWGAINPSGKLSVSFPQDIGTAPAYYNYPKTGRSPMAGVAYPNGTLQFGWQYVLNTPTPIWSFGHGLSYTTFSYSNLVAPSSIVNTTSAFNLTVEITNNGTVAGAEVVQVYSTDEVSSVVTSQYKLVGFEKVYLEAGETQTVTVEVGVTDGMGLWNLQNQWVVEPGDFTINVGSASDDFRLTTTLVVTA